MASQELVKTLDFILNRCNEKDIEAVAAAVIRRRRDIGMFGSMPMAPDPHRMAEEITSQFNLEGNVENLKKSVREYTIRTIRQMAPELTDKQVDELTGAWIPDKTGAGKKPEKADSLSRDMLASMIDQFISFSLGRMEEEDDKALRREIGPWPDKYWKAFPQVIRLLITDFLKGEMDERDFNSRIGLALQSR